MKTPLHAFWGRVINRKDALMLAMIDANVAIYAFADFSDPRKSTISRDLLLNLAVNSECVLSVQVLKEFANVCTKKLRDRITEASLILRLEQLGALPMVETNPALVLSATRRHYLSQISFYDALMVEAAIVSGATVLYTEDLSHGQLFGTLRIVNPFL